MRAALAGCRLGRTRSRRWRSCASRQGWRCATVRAPGTAVSMISTRCGRICRAQSRRQPRPRHRQRCQATLRRRAPRQAWHRARRRASCRRRHPASLLARRHPALPPHGQTVRRSMEVSAITRESRASPTLHRPPLTGPRSSLPNVATRPKLGSTMAADATTLLVAFLAGKEETGRTGA